MKIYCKSCGNENSYLGAKPKFCQACGESFQAKKITPQQNKKVIYVASDEEERETNFDPNTFDLRGMIDDFINSDDMKKIKKQFKDKGRGIKLAVNDNGKIDEHESEEE